jgi:hypothetical protein
MIPSRFKPRNPARFVTITQEGFKTTAEIDNHGNLITTTSTRNPVLPILGGEKHPSPSSELPEQVTTREIEPNLEFARIEEPRTKESMGNCSENARTTYSLKNLLH